MNTVFKWNLMLQDLILQYFVVRCQLDRVNLDVSLLKLIFMK